MTRGVAALRGSRHAATADVEVVQALAESSPVFGHRRWEESRITEPGWRSVRVRFIWLHAQWRGRDGPV